MISLLLKLLELFKDLFWWAVSELPSAIGTTLIAAIMAVIPAEAIEIGEPIWTALGYANRWMPLNEALGLFITYIPIALAVWVYRIVKSWVPTVAGT